ncbi:MAG: sensor domain-containing diguanylate cyclase [Nitrospirota bacterium]
MTDITSIGLFSGVVLLIMVMVFHLGRRSGSSIEKNRHIEEAKDFEKRITLVESSKNELNREISNLKELNEKYVYFLVRVPETVKHLNSALTLDEAISSIIRFTKDIIDTDCIELYLYNEAAGQLELEAAYGSNKKNRISIPYGEGLIGKAAELKVITSRETLMLAAKKADDRVYMAAPVMFKNRLIGVLGLGKVKSLTGDEKRMIAMIADLAGVSLQNCERLSSAQEEANTDSLTGLYNRKYFAERSLDEAQKAISYNFPISIFIFDIDHFKKYNDNNGHAEGDYLLRELGRLLKENTRGRDIIARYGGEEFIVMLPNTNKEGAYLYGEKIRKIIESARFRHREKQPLGLVSVSGGIATFPADAETIESTIKLADAALYKSKEAGRNRVTKFEHSKLT